MHMIAARLGLPPDRTAAWGAQRQRAAAALPELDSALRRCNRAAIALDAMMAAALTVQAAPARQAHCYLAAEAPGRPLVPRAHSCKRGCDHPSAAAQPIQPAAAASGGRRDAWRLHAAAGQAQAVQERHGDWVLTVQVSVGCSATASSMLMVSLQALWQLSTGQPSHPPTLCRRRDTLRRQWR